MFVMPLVTRPRDKIWLFWYWLISYNTFSYWSIFYCLWDQTPGHILKLPITIFLSFKTIKRFLYFWVSCSTWSDGQPRRLSDLVFLQMSSLRNLNIFQDFLSSLLFILKSFTPSFLPPEGWLHWFLMNTKWFRLHLIPFKRQYKKVSQMFYRMKPLSKNRSCLESYQV